jgi:hypothetical protein
MQRSSDDDDDVVDANDGSTDKDVSGGMGDDGAFRVYTAAVGEEE